MTSQSPCKPVRGMHVRPDCAEHYVLRVEFGPDADPDYNFEVALVRTADTGSNPWRGYEASANAYLADLGASEFDFDQIFQSTLFDPADGDVFGHDVAIDGDAMVVGAYLEDSDASVVNQDQSSNLADSSGAAYVFVRDGSGLWSQQGYLKASNTDTIDRFGESVALDGIGIAIGAPGETSAATGIDGNQTDNTSSSSGAVYVFR